MLHGTLRGSISVWNHGVQFQSNANDNATALWSAPSLQTTQFQDGAVLATLCDCECSKHTPSQHGYPSLHGARPSCLHGRASPLLRVYHSVALAPVATTASPVIISSPERNISLYCLLGCVGACIVCLVLAVYLCVRDYLTVAELKEVDLKELEEKYVAETGISDQPLMKWFLRTIFVSSRYDDKGAFAQRDRVAAFLGLLVLCFVTAAVVLGLFHNYPLNDKSSTFVGVVESFWDSTCGSSSRHPSANLVATVPATGQCRPIKIAGSAQASHTVFLKFSCLQLSDKSYVAEVSSGRTHDDCDHATPARYPQNGCQWSKKAIGIADMQGYVRVTCALAAVATQYYEALLPPSDDESANVSSDVFTSATKTTTFSSSLSPPKYRYWYTACDGTSGYSSSQEPYRYLSRSHRRRFRYLFAGKHSAGSYCLSASRNLPDDGAPRIVCRG